MTRSVIARRAQHAEANPIRNDKSKRREIALLRSQ